MAKNEKDGIKPSVILLGSVVLLLLIGAAIFGSSYLETSRAHADTKITISPIEPAAAPPEAPDLAERVRTFFMKGNVEECMRRHLGHESRVEGLLEVELLPDGTVANAEAKTEPQNGGVALCVQQRFARGFTFSGEIQRVSYTFNARWDSTRLVMGQNVTSTRK